MLDFATFQHFLSLTNNNDRPLYELLSWVCACAAVGPSERPIAHLFLATGKIELYMPIFTLAFIGKNENFKQLILSVILGCFQKAIFNKEIHVKNVQLE